MLEVSDRGVPSLTTTAQITVNIEDVDDNPPIFPVCHTLLYCFSRVFNISANWQEPPHYTIREDQSILTPFAVLQTEDRDTPENSDVFYYITGKSWKNNLSNDVCVIQWMVGGESTEYFDVFSQTGQLYLNQPVV